MGKFSKQMDELASRNRATTFLRYALIVGLVVRAVILWHTGDLGTGIVDEQHYRRLASNIYDHREFAATAGEPTSIRPPLYPALIAAVWAITSPQNLQAIRVVQILLALGTTVLVYRIGQRVFNHQTACYAAAMCWLYPSLVFFNFLILTETLFTFLLLVFVLLTVRVVQQPGVAVAATAGVALGLAALTRSVLWPVPLLLCPLLLLLIRETIPRRVLRSTLLLGGYLVVVLPWAVRNTRLQETVTVVDTMGGINLRMGNYEFTPDDRMWDAVSLTGDRSWVRGFAVAPGVNPTEGRKDKWAQAKALEYMRAHPSKTLHRFLIKFGDLWGLEREFIAGVQTGLFSPPQWFAVGATVAIVLAYAFVVIFGAAGIWLTRPADWRLHVVLLFPVLLTVAAHTIVFGHSRYHVPLIPIVGLYAAHLLAVRQPLWQQLHRPAFIGAAVTVAVLAAIWIRQVAVVDAARLGSLFHHIAG